jgi:Helicase HerA, central domain
MASSATALYEKLGVFYLGKPFDLATNTLGSDPVLYDSKDLVTHAVIVGMTGSGKTGLGLSLIEEAAMDGVPVLAIDPKGDLGNLLLTFPDLAPGDFKPWVDPDEAARKGITLDAFAEQEAATWKKGLEAWGQDGERIARLRNAADFTIYTPGSRAGRPVSILESFNAPSEAEREDTERMAEAVTTTATSVLTLLGVDADPVQSREHILLSAVLNDAWCKGENLDLAAIIHRIQQPPFARVGVLDLEAFYPEKDRFALAMRVNGLLAAPSFALWLEGEPLDIAKMLYTPQGKPRVAVVSVAHLSDSERMFFLTLLLNRVVTWMRSQSGTSSLRAMLYLDEVAGYMPPVANPPSKQALLLLMKQARAFGLGVVLATQNPIDIDYKGLSNAGTWFLGRLQTERDKARLLDGLEGALQGQGHTFDRGETERILSSLQKRTFFLHDVHEDHPVIFQTRWAMSYLRGPLTREQIKLLTPKAAPGAPAVAADGGAGAAGAATKSSAPADAPPPVPGKRAAASADASAGVPSAPPVLPPQVEQFFAPAKPGLMTLAYEPMLFAKASVRFVEPKRGIDVARDVVKLVQFGSGAVLVDWESAEDADLDAADLETAPAGPATFEALPPAAAKSTNYGAWLKEFARWLQQEQVLSILYDPATELCSQADETDAAFRARVNLKDREARDAEKERLRQKYAPKAATLTERIRRAEQQKQVQEQQASEAKMQTGISVLGTIAGALFGRKAMSMGTLGKATTAARGMGRTMRESSDVGRANETLETYKAQLQELEHDIEAEIAGLEAGAAPPTRAFTTIEIRPKKTHVVPERVVLVWRP